MDKHTAWHLIIEKIDNFQIERGITSFVNPYSMLVLDRYPELVGKIDHWYVDGISLVKKLNPLLRNKVSRFSFDETSVAPLIFNFARENSLKIGIIGTTEQSLLAAIANITAKHNVQISLYRNGYFSDDRQRQDCIAQIIANHIDIVICGMGTPNQELFLISLKNKGWNGYGFTCGGYLHQTAKGGDYYPRLIDKLHLRWLYRIFDEPKLISRYFVDYPKFFLKFYSFERRFSHKGF